MSGKIGETETIMWRACDPVFGTGIWDAAWPA